LVGRFLTFLSNWYEKKNADYGETYVPWPKDGFEKKNGIPSGNLT
jgi:hypothetical protein